MEGAVALHQLSQTMAAGRADGPADPALAAYVRQAGLRVGRDACRQVPLDDPVAILP
jgi:hypothetical protein